MNMASPFSVTNKGNSLSNSYHVKISLNGSLLRGGSNEVNSGELLIKPCFFKTKIRAKI